MPTENSVARETEEGQVDASEGTGAQEDDLDKLLSEWDGTEEVESESESKKPTAEDLQSFLSEYREDKKLRDQERTQKDVAQAVELIREEMGGEKAPLSETRIRWLLNGAAGEDPRLRQAWIERNQNPKGYQKVLKALAREFASDFSDIDRGATEDREAVRAAVRGASTKAPAESEVPDFTGKSDQEFYAWLRQQARNK